MRYLTFIIPAFILSSCIPTDRSNIFDPLSPSFDDNETTGSVLVTLSIKYGSWSHMWVSNDPDFPRGGWEPVSETKVWTLTSGNGMKRVYAKFKDPAQSRSKTIFDTIALNSISEHPEVSIVIVPGGDITGLATIQANSTPIISWSLSGISADKVKGYVIAVEDPQDNYTWLVRKIPATITQAKYGEVQEGWIVEVTPQPLKYNGEYFMSVFAYDGLDPQESNPLGFGAAVVLVEGGI